MVFHEVGLDKDGRLNLKEFSALLTQREDDTTKEFGSNIWFYSDAQKKDRWDFLCKISYSDKGPTVKSFQKWMNMWLHLQNKNVEVEDAPEEPEDE